VFESRVSQVHASAVIHLRAALKDLSTRSAIGRKVPPRATPARPRANARGGE
jgi:hypothetical protein